MKTLARIPQVQARDEEADYREGMRWARTPSEEEFDASMVAARATPGWRGVRPRQR